MVTTETKKKKRDEESNNIGLGKTENKHSGTEVEQHTFRNKLKEDL
jgi:hypothetical protein